MNIFSIWEKGAISDQQAFDALMSDRAEVEEIYNRAKNELDSYRARIEQVVRRMGGRASGAGYDATVVRETVSVNYDTKQLDTLMAELLAAGDAHTAGRIAKARKESTRLGYLRIAKTKGKEGNGP